jgi:DNA-binding transcriptional LysR family regulator
VPQHPSELAAHSCLAFTGPPFSPAWVFEKGGEAVRVAVRGALQVNRLPLVMGAALAGLGIARLPTYLCREELADGRLVPVLGSWPIAARAVNLCWLDAGPLPEKLRRFVEHLADWGRKQLDQSATAPGPARRQAAANA